MNWKRQKQEKIKIVSHDGDIDYVCTDDDTFSTIELARKHQDWLTDPTKNKDVSLKEKYGEK